MDSSGVYSGLIIAHIYAPWEVQNWAWILQGWRIEIKKYPKLTEKGAWRGPADAQYGGFYTQAEVCSKGSHLVPAIHTYANRNTPETTNNIDACKVCRCQGLLSLGHETKSLRLDARWHSLRLIQIQAQAQRVLNCTEAYFRNTDCLAGEGDCSLCCWQIHRSNSWNWTTRTLLCSFSMLPWPFLWASPSSHNDESCPSYHCIFIDFLFDFRDSFEGKTLNIWQCRYRRNKGSARLLGHSGGCLLCCESQYICVLKIYDGPASPTVVAYPPHLSNRSRLTSYDCLHVHSACNALMLAHLDRFQTSSSISGSHLEIPAIQIRWVS